MAEVVLRPMKLEDQEMVMNWRSLPEITRYMNTDPTPDIEAQIAWFKRQESNPNAYFWIIEVDGMPVGVSSITEINRANGTCTRGTYIAVKAKRSFDTITRIYGTQHDFVFDTLGLNKIEIQVFAENDGVVKLNKLCGFTEEGVLRKHICKHGIYYDVVNLGILKEEWYEKRKKLNCKPVVLMDYKK